MSEQARIALTVRGNTFEISGPDAFVTAQAEAFREAIISSLNSAAASETETDDVTPDTEPPAAPHQDTAVNQKQYQNVLHIDGDKVQILKSVHGTTKSKKATGTIILYLWGKRQAGKDSVPFGELRELCKAHGCLDDANFAKNLRQAREWIIIEGDKGSSLQTAKLTVPGVEKGVALLKQLNGDASAEDPGDGK